MKTKETKIKKTLEKLLSMQVIGYIVYPSVILWSDRDSFDDPEEEKFLVDYENRDLLQEVNGVYDALFQKVAEKAEKYVLNDNKSTIVLEDDCKKWWYFHKHDLSFTLSDERPRQGWDYEYDPTDQNNPFSGENLWF